MTPREQETATEKMDRPDQCRLAEECSKLDPEFEQELADQGIGIDLDQWPEY